MTPFPPVPGRTARRVAALAGAAALAGIGFAYAQGAGPFYDPMQLPETAGTVKQYTLTPRGDVDGLILQDGTEVKLPPHLSTQVVYAIRPGDRVSVRGLKARAIPLVSAAVIKNEATGATVVDDGGPRGREGSEQVMTGQVSTALHGARGETNGVILDNGTIVRLPPPEAERWASLLAAGQTLSVRGPVTATLLGKVMEARAVGTSPDQMSLLAAPPPKKGPRPPRYADTAPMAAGAFPPAPAGNPPPPPAGADVAQPPAPAGAPPVRR